MKKLPRLKQCQNCPWKKSVDIHTIPNGYDNKSHKSILSQDISDLTTLHQSMKVMACHHSNDKDEMYCVGYLHNQLGVGNNIGLRIRMLNYSNVGKIKIEGEQHAKFEDLIPENL